jgi:oligoendopeptidase F
MKLNKTKGSIKYKPRIEIPPIATIKTEWDLASLYYRNDRDKKIEEDIEKAEAMIRRFVKKWKKTSFTSDAHLLQLALTEYEALSAEPAISRPTRYYWLRSCLDVNDTKAEQQLALLARRLRKVKDELLFFVLQIGALTPKEQKVLLKDRSLSQFHYHLTRIFRSSRHNLTEIEEKIINLKSPQSYSMWLNMTEKIISNRSIVWNDQEFKIPEAIEQLNVVEFDEKELLWDTIRVELQQIGEVAEHEFNAIVTDAHVENEQRSYKKPYSATVIAYEDSEENLESLIDVVSRQGFAISRQFYKTKAAIHNTNTLRYSERNAHIGDSVEIPWEEALLICRDVFYNLSSEYGSIFDAMLQNGQIDVFPRKGKQGGAFMSDQTGHPVHVMLNYTPTFSSLETLAHEMGHAIHATRSSQQRSFYDGHSTITAETASTLFENFVFDAVYEQASEMQKFYLLHDRLVRDISTIQRQVAFFNLELAIHNYIISNGAITNEQLRKMTINELRRYLGPAVTLHPNDGYSYVYIGHLRYGFYVYTYTFGLLMSSIMARQYKRDKSFIHSIDNFLSLGASASVTDIFKTVGIQTSNKDTFIDALDTHKKEVIDFTRLAKKISL